MRTSRRSTASQVSAWDTRLHPRRRREPVAKGVQLGVSGVAAAAAAAAIEDRDHVSASLSRNADDRQEFFNKVNARMLRVIDSQTNFAMLDTLRPAVEVVAHFARHGLVLPPPFARYSNHVRVSMGTPAQMDEFWRVLGPDAGDPLARMSFVTGPVPR